MFTPNLTITQHILRIFAVYCLLMFYPWQAQSQLLPTGTTETQEEETQESEIPADSLGRRTPRGTVSGFIKSVADKNYSRASLYLNLEEVQNDPEEGERLARVLQRLLDEGGRIRPYSWLSNETSGRQDDELPPSVDLVGTVNLNGENFQLTVEETKGPEGNPLWLFSSHTVENIASVTHVVGSTLLVERLLPDFLKDNLWGGVPIGQWFIIVILIALAYFVAWCLTWLVIFAIKKFWNKAKREPTSGIIDALALPVRIFVAVLLFVASSQEIGISIIIRQSFNEITTIAGLIAVLLLLWQLNDFITRFTERRMTSKGQFSAVSIILFVRRVAKAAIIIIGIIAILGSFGVNVTAGLAALGIGGLALALGAQKSLENFVGSITLIADRPLRIGDFCKIGDTVGTVEQIGMRSTRLRTLDRTIVTIPNGELSGTRIENYAHRDQFRFNTVFNFRYETTKDQMRFLLIELRKILYAHPKVDPQPARVRFVAFAAASLDVEIFAYLKAADFNDFVEIREDLLLRMMEVVEKSGTGFAFPSQTIYFARDPGLSSEKTEQAEETVRKWKEKGKMQIPNFKPQDIEDLKDSLSYPPEGSSTYSKEEPKMF